MTPSLLQHYSVYLNYSFLFCPAWIRRSIRPEPVLKTWDSKSLALIAQMVRAFGINPKVVVRVPLRSRHFLSQKLWQFHKNIRSCVENEYCCMRTVNMSNVNFTLKNVIYIMERPCLIVGLEWATCFAGLIQMFITAWDICILRRLSSRKITLRLEHYSVYFKDSFLFCTVFKPYFDQVRPW